MPGMAAFGTTLSMGRGQEVAAGGDTFDVIANVTGISGPGLSADTADVTAHNSEGAWEEVVATILRSGDLTLDLNYNPAEPTHSADTTPPSGGEGLAAALQARKWKNFKLTFPTSPTIEWSFKGFVTGFEPDAPHDDKLSASATIKLTGKPTFNT